MNRYDRYPGDYLRHTLTLTPAQDGMYTRLMDYYYSTEKAIPKEEVMAAARCRNADDEVVTQWVLDRFFTLTAVGYRHDRIEQEIEKARPRIEAAKLNGIKGGRPKKNPVGSSRVSQQEPSGNPGQKLPSPSPSPSQSEDQELSDQQTPLILTDPPIGEQGGSGTKPKGRRRRQGEPTGDSLFDAINGAYEAVLCAPERNGACRLVFAPTPTLTRKIAGVDKLARSACMRQGWDYDRDGFWKSYFGECLNDPWLRGDVPDPNSVTWKQNLEVLIADKRFDQIMGTVITRMRAER